MLADAAGETLNSSAAQGSILLYVRPAHRPDMLFRCHSSQNVTIINLNHSLKNIRILTILCDFFAKRYISTGINLSKCDKIGQ